MNKSLTNLQAVINGELFVAEELRVKNMIRLEGRTNITGSCKVVGSCNLGDSAANKHQVNGDVFMGEDLILNGNLNANSRYILNTPAPVDNGDGVPFTYNDIDYQPMIYCKYSESHAYPKFEWYRVDSGIIRWNVLSHMIVKPQTRNCERFFKYQDDSHKLVLLKSGVYTVSVNFLKPNGLKNGNGGEIYLWLRFKSEKKKIILANCDMYNFGGNNFHGGICSTFIIPEPSCPGDIYLNLELTSWFMFAAFSWTMIRMPLYQ